MNDNATKTAEETATNISPDSTGTASAPTVGAEAQAANQNADAAKSTVEPSEADKIATEAKTVAHTSERDLRTRAGEILDTIVEKFEAGEHYVGEKLLALIADLEKHV